MLREPQTIAETIEMETVTLEFDRPVMHVKAPAIANGYVDENILVGVYTHSLVEYYPKRTEPPYYGRDTLDTAFWINASAFRGFVHSVEFSCSVDDESCITWHSKYFETYNATVVEHNSTVNQLLFRLKALKPSLTVMIPLTWIFFDGDGSVEHQLRLNVHTVYYNGTAYREVVIPLRIKIARDVGNTFEDAKLIGPSESIGSLDSVDRIDVYALHLQEGETINVTLIPPKEANFNLYLYNQNHEELAKSDQAGNQTETITYIATQTEIYYITIEYQDWPAYTSRGIYQLKIEIS